ncbi:MAG: tRNA pseudouridine(38-40) synthase TruA [Candidatus Omnitrophica bacterium]|nr:tRNA pseudouridine(38-40) synthase TruA [Candidatus Omnitrophota bacterium]
MRNFKLTLEYDGTDFSGWQTQFKGLRTIQNHLEEKLEMIFKKKIHCQASGRTDGGVHAIGQVAHFKVETEMPASLILKALNSFLDKDLSVTGLEEVPLHFHAQKDVINKTYRYSILNRPYPSALLRNRAYFYPYKLKLSRMRQAANDLKGTHDFKPFQSAGKRSRIKNTIRTIINLTIVKQGDLIYITITSNGFLYKMVRNIVGALIAIGCGRMAGDSIPLLLKSAERKLAPRTVPSHGLCLISVDY